MSALGAAAPSPAARALCARFAIHVCNTRGASAPAWCPLGVLWVALGQHTQTTQGYPRLGVGFGGCWSPGWLGHHYTLCIPVPQACFSHLDPKPYPLGCVTPSQVANCPSLALKAQFVHKRIQCRPWDTHHWKALEKSFLVVCSPPKIQTWTPPTQPPWLTPWASQPPETLPAVVCIHQGPKKRESYRLKLLNESFPTVCFLSPSHNLSLS